MRRLVVLGLILIGVTSLFAQESETDSARVQKDSRAQERLKNLRIAYISEKLALTPSQAEKFWPLYREFVQERAKLRADYRTAQFSGDPEHMDPKKQQALIDLGLRTRQEELDLEKTYSTKLLQVINPEQMLKLHKAEKEFRSMIINQLQQRRSMQQRREFFREKNQQNK